MTLIVVLTGLAIIGILAAGKAYAITTDVPSPQSNIPYRNLFTKYSGQYQVPMRLMVAIVSHESGFDPRAVNYETAADARKGRNVDSLGLGQILYPDTAKDYGVTDRDSLFDPDVNLQLTARHIHNKIMRYPLPDEEGFHNKAVSAYNAGTATIHNADYVEAVRREWRKYSDVI